MEFRQNKVIPTNSFNHFSSTLEGVLLSFSTINLGLSKLLENRVNVLSAYHLQG